MKPRAFSPPRGVTARADLLRLLAVAPCRYLPLDDDGERGLAYQEDKTRVLSPDDRGEAKVGALPLSSANTGNFKLPLQMPFVHVVAERQTRERLNQAQNTVQSAVVFEPIREEDAKPPSAVRLVDYQDLVPKARLMPALKRYLSGNRSAGLDVPRLVEQLAGQRLPRHLPRCQLNTWHSHWVVVLDFAKRLWPYRQDMHRLAENLLHACGRSGVSIRIVNHGPLQHWTDWVEEQRAGGALPAKHAWRMPPAGTPVLLVSDLGLLEGSDSPSHRSWQAFIGQLGAAQTRPFALLPLGAEQLDGGLPHTLTLLRWSPDARLHPLRPLGRRQTMPEGLDDLLAMASVTRRVDPPLLRAMRRLNPKAPLNAGLEGAFWRHADVEAGSAANLRREAQAKHLAHFAERLSDRHLELEPLRYRHHAHLRAVLNHEETLLWGAHAKPEGGLAAGGKTEQRLNDAQAFMRRLAATLQQKDALQKGGVWWQVAQDIVQRADDRMGECYRPLFTPLARAIAEVSRAWDKIPGWVDPADLTEGDSTAVLCWLVRDPAAGGIVLQSTPPARNQSALAEPLPIDPGGLRIESAGSTTLLSLRRLPYRVCGLQEETEIRLTTSRESMTLAAVKRPRGARAWGCDNEGVWVQTPTLYACQQRWKTKESGVVPEKNRTGQGFFLRRTQLRTPPVFNVLNLSDRSFEVAFDLDEFGISATLQIISRQGPAWQVFRWIEPGHFRMGSPNDEPERFDNEGPQHDVTTTRGFWLADTACTQALWQAVMGDNPSRFKGDPNLPVEQVSWHDVQNFLRQLEKWLPGCQADLPSEAEWEYACRAGTATPFSFGANIDPEQVNYDGNYPYAGGKKGEYRERTVPVKSLPANPWGLYEMHGNVWEWCKDGRRTYNDRAQSDPLGPVEGDVPRCLRGGSWSGGAGWARSAVRGARWPGFAGRHLGFRFCLRSIQSSQEQALPGGTPGLASGASPDASQRDVESRKRGRKPKSKS